VTSNPPFEQVVARHGPTVLRVCRAVAGSSDAEDAWSETFLAALRAYPDLPPGANLGAWLVRIAHNKAVDLVRAGARQRAVSVALANGTARHTPGPEPGWAEVVATLPPRQRQAVAYHHLAGLPYADVAEIIGGTPSAARRAAADGVAALRRQLQKEE
jgi:DNA-directed RNA polymerase specialized sigma24 family protein